MFGNVYDFIDKVNKEYPVFDPNDRSCNYDDVFRNWFIGFIKNELETAKLVSEECFVVLSYIVHKGGKIESEYDNIFNVIHLNYYVHSQMIYDAAEMQIIKSYEEGLITLSQYLNLNNMNSEMLHKDTGK